MTGRGGSEGDMPNLWWLSRQDAPDMGDTSLAALLAGSEPAEGLPPGLQPLADALATLTVRPASDELAGEAAALAEVDNRVGVPVERQPITPSEASVAHLAAVRQSRGRRGRRGAGPWWLRHRRVRRRAARPGPAIRAPHLRRTGRRRWSAHRYTSQRDRHASWSGCHRPDGVRAMHRLGARQSTRHQQPAGGGLPQPGGRRRWRQQRNRLLRCRATSPGIVLPQLPPGRATSLPPDWPPDLAPHWPTHLTPDWPPHPPASHPTGPPTS